MRLKELISKLNKISDEYNHDNPNVIISLSSLGRGREPLAWGGY